MLNIYLLSCMQPS